MTPKEPLALIGYPDGWETTVVKVLYLYACARRKASVKTELDLIAVGSPLIFEIDEIDILQENSDLSDDKTWKDLQDKLAEGFYDVVLTSPPCESFTRSV
jgi:hypothetical protein